MVCLFYQIGEREREREGEGEGAEWVLELRFKRQTAFSVFVYRLS